MAEIVVTLVNPNDTVVVQYPLEAQIAVIQRKPGSAGTFDPTEPTCWYATVGVKFVK